MNNKYIFLLVGLIAGAGIVFSVRGQVQTGKDFPGGNVPSNLVTGSASGGLTGNGYVQPVGSLSSNAQNGLTIGGADQYHGFTIYESASGTPASVIALNAFGSATGTAATTTLTVPETAGLAVGDICNGGIATTTSYISGCFLNATNGATGTAIVAYANGTNASLSIPTSTIIRISFEHLPY